MTTDIFAFPLSFSQQRLWFLEQLQGNSTAYNIPVGVRLSGSLNVAVLEKSLNEIVQRHEVLRTTFSVLDNVPMQVVSPIQHLSIQITDLEHLPQGQQETEIQRLAILETQKGFDIEHGPLLRASLLRLNENEHVMLATIHHIVFDGWSVGVFLKELNSLYKAFIANQPSPLTELPVQYADFAIWQQEWLQGENLANTMDYWRQQLHDVSILQLPSEHPRPEVMSFKGSCQTVRFSSDLSKFIKKLSQHEGVSLFMTLLAAFKVLLHRYTQQTDICVGTFIANRDRQELEPLIGFFVNNLALRTDVSGNPTFRQLLKRVREVTLDAYAHQNIPFEKLLTELQPERNPAYMPIFQVMFVLQNAPGTGKAELADLSMTPLTLPQTRSDFDLTLYISEIADELDVSLEYSTDLFEPATITRMLKHFEALLCGVVDNPDQSLLDLPLLTDTERQQLLADYSHSAKIDFPITCIHTLFEEQAAQTPNEIALISEKQQLSYRQLNQRANQLAHFLQKTGVQVETCVGVFLERSTELIITIFGILKAGGAYVPLDPNYPTERLIAMLNNTTQEGEKAIPILLTQRRLVDRLPDHQSLVICLDELHEAIAQEENENLPLSSTPTDLAYVLYTSGSSGKPKGVMVEHHSLSNLGLALRKKYNLQVGERVLQFASLCFDTSAEEIYPCLISGGTLVLRTETMLRSAAAFFESCATWEINVLDLPSAYWHELVVQMDTEGLTFPASVRLVIIGGERAIPERLKTWFKHVGEQVCLVNTYGTTEITAVATWGELNRPDAGDNWGEVTIGRPIANTFTYILDSTHQPTPIGVPGGLYVGGTGVARGYLNQPELSAERFVNDPFNTTPGARLYCTGDIARYLPDGNIQYLGRQDHQVKIRGFRIETGEIEAALRQEATVHDAIVIAREDIPGERYLAAYLLSRNGQLDMRTLRNAIKSRLPEFMLPSAWMQISEMPLTPTGKLDRKALPVPETKGLESNTPFAAPRTRIEELLADTWKDVLHLERVSIHDNFFELGGHSLLATQVVSRLRQSLKIDLPLQTLFDTPTLADLAVQIENCQRLADGDAHSILPVPRGLPLPLSFSQQRLWFLAQLNPESAAYNIPLATHLNGSLDYPALESSLNRLVERHEVLRTTFQMEDEQPVQVIHRHITLTLPVTDLAELSEAEQEKHIRSMAALDAAQPFDLEKGPLLRLHLLRLNEQEHILLLNMHHIISDGWSMDIFVRELATLYQETSQPLSAQNSLHPIPIQYADFAVWQRQWLQGETLQNQLAYWKDHLADAPPVLEIPGDHPRPAIQTFRGAQCSGVIPSSLLKAVKAFSQSEDATLFMTLLAAFQTLLYRYTGQTDIVVGTPIANRNHTEIEGLIGFFVNTLALRTNLADVTSFRELLKRVREVALGAYAHQDLPFEMLVEALQPKRSLSHTPIFQIMFILQNAPASGIELPGISLQPITVENTTTKFDLTLSCLETKQGLELSATYNADIFEPATITRLFAHFGVLLKEIVNDCEQSPAHLPLLTPKERQQLLTEWNSTKPLTPSSSCLHELFEAQVEKKPLAPAIVFEERLLTYNELNQRANQLARHLVTLGVGTEDLIGIYMDRSLEVIVSMLAILKAGGTYVPIDPKMPIMRLAAMLENIRPAAMITQQSLYTTLSLDRVPTICLDNDWSTIAQQNQTNLNKPTAPEQLAYTLFTSGSTGHPKGIGVEHRQLVNYLDSITRKLVLPPGSNFATVSTFSADLGNTVIFPALCNGGCLHVISSERIMEPAALAEYNQQHAIDCIKIVPSHLAVLLESPQAAQILPRKWLVTGGEALSWELAQTIHTLAPNCRLLNHYGPTETTVGVLTYPVPFNGQRPSTTTVPLGRPLDNVKAYILDQHLNPVPVGIPGEIYIGGNTLARGYLHRPDLTAERFVPNPFGKGERLYQTGDLARYLPDGNIEFLGRVDHQVKIRGFRVELGEIEAALKQHPQVCQAIAMLREDTPGEPLLAAYILLVEETKLSTSNLRDFLKSTLPEYMIPTVFIFLETLPLTSNGKLDRSQLPAPNARQAELDAYIAPQTSDEKALADIWAQVLKSEQIGRNDNFFGRGGHSLMALQLVNRLRETFQVEMPLQALYEAPTIAELARRIEESRGASLPPLERISRNEKLALSVTQQALWNLLFPSSTNSPTTRSHQRFRGIFANHNTGKTGTNPWQKINPIVATVYLQGTLNHQVFTESLKLLRKRHENLHTRIIVEDGQVFQEIREDDPEGKPEIDFRIVDLPTSKSIETLIKQERQHIFDIEKDCLWRITLVKLTNREQVLVLTLHPLIADTTSASVLVRDIAAIYQAGMSNTPPALPDIPIQYVDYAAWQRKVTSEDALKSQLDFWRQSLDGYKPLFSVNSSHNDSTSISFSPIFVLTKAQIDGVKALSQQCSVPWTLTLAATFQTLLHYCTKEEDIALAISVPHRPYKALEGVIGPFANYLTLRTYFTNDLGFQGVLQHLRDAFTASLENQDVPFETISKHSQLVQAVFTMEEKTNHQVQASGISFSGLNIIGNESNFEIGMHIQQSNLEISGQVSYNPKLFDCVTIERFAKDYQALVDNILEAPESPISAFVL